MPESQYSISAVISVASKNASFATWNSGTALNSAAQMVNDDFSYNTIVVTLSQTTTITGGVVTFEGSTDGVTFFPMQGFAPGTFTPIGPTYTLQASTYATFSFNLTAIPFFQVRLSTVLTGTGAVTVGYAADSFVNTIAAAVTGTVAATQSGTWTVQQGTPPWIFAGSLTHNNAAPIANNVGALVAVASSAAPTYTTGDQVLLSTDLAGNLRTTTAIAANASVNVNQWAGTNLGAPTNFGTTPGAVVAGSVNSSLFAGTTGLTATGTSLNTNITNTVTAAGNLTNNNAAPAATNVGVLPAIAETAYATVTYTTGDQVLPVTDLHGALNQDLQAVAGIALGATAVTNFGTAPAATAVPGVNASIYAGTTGLTATGSSLNANVTNTVTVSGTVTANQGTSPWVVSLTSTTITGTVAVTQSTSPWVVAGNKTNNNAAPGATNEGVLPAVANAATQTWTEGNQVAESVDLSGRQRMRGTLTNNNAAPAADQLSVLPALANAAAPTWTEGDQVLESVDLKGNQRTALLNWGGTTLGAPANYGTSPGAVIAGSVNAFITNTVPVTLTSTTITGTVAVTQSTSPWITAGNLTNNNAAPNAQNVGVLPAIAETAYATVTYTTGDQVLPVTDLHGALNQDLQAVAGVALGATAVTNFGTAPAAAAVPGVNASIFAGTTALTATGSSLNANITNTVTVSGTVTANQGTSPWVVAGNKTNNNAAPGATNEGVLPALANAASPAWTEGNQVLESVDLTGRQRVRGTLTNNNAAPTSDQLSVMPAIANAAVQTWTEGDQVLLSTDLKGNLREAMMNWAGTALGTPTNFGTTPGAVIAGSVNSSVFIGTVAAVAASAGVQKVGISGGTGASLDSTVGPGAAPTNAVAVGGIYNTTEPAPTNTQFTALQQDQAADLLMFPGLQFKTGAVWNSGTAGSTLQFPTGTATAGALLGGGAVMVQLDQTTTITAGAVTFQGTYDNINWVTIPVAQVLNPNGFATLTNPYSFQANTNKPFMIVLNGYVGVRANLSTPITGTGTVTPFWATLFAAPITPVTVSNLPSTTRTYITLVLDNVSEPAAEALQTMNINSGGTTTTATTYTVTSGKTFRIQSMTFGHLNSASASQAKVRLRSAAAVTATSSILIALVGGHNTGGSNMYSFAEQNMGDGLEVASGQQVGISLINLGAAGNGTATVTVVGYEY